MTTFHEALAANVLGVESSQIKLVERIKHGLTNDSWRVHTDRDAVIVRASNVAETLLQIDRASEARVLAAAARAGLGPDVLLCDPGRRVLVTRDHGATWSLGDARQPANIRRLAALLRRLHDLAIPAGVRRVDLVATMRGYLRALDERGYRGALAMERTRRRGENAALALRQRTIETLCHNDVHHLNVIEGDTLRLIDWEYAGIGEPFFDLASVCVYHEYGRHEREQLLDAYLPTPGSDASHRLELACWLFDYVRELWHEVRAHVARE